MQKLARVEGGIGEALDLGANEVIHRASEHAHRRGATTVEKQICWGDPAASVLDVIKSRRPDLVIVGRRGRGRLAGLLLGSVSQKLVSLAPCAVAVVP